MKGNRLNIPLSRGENSSEVTIDYVINRKILFNYCNKLKLLA